MTVIALGSLQSLQAFITTQAQKQNPLRVCPSGWRMPWSFRSSQTGAPRISAPSTSSLAVQQKYASSTRVVVAVVRLRVVALVDVIGGVGREGVVAKARAKSSSRRRRRSRRRREVIEVTGGAVAIGRGSSKK